MWKIPPFLWFWEAGREFFKRNSDQGTNERATDFCSASFPSLPVAHDGWHFPKENKGVAEAKERLRKRAAGSKLAQRGRRRLPVLSLAGTPGLTAEPAATLCPLLRGRRAAASVPSTLRAPGVGAGFWNARRPGSSVPLHLFHEDSEAKLIYGVCLQQPACQAWLQGGRLTYHDLMLLFFFYNLYSGKPLKGRNLPSHRLPPTACK